MWRINRRYKMPGWHKSLKGETVRCTATERPCPRLAEGSPHGDTPEEVDRKYEEMMKEKETSSLQKTTSKSKSSQRFSFIKDSPQENKNKHMDAIQYPMPEILDAAEYAEKDAIRRTQAMSKDETIDNSNFDDNVLSIYHESNQFASNVVSKYDLSEDETEKYHSWVSESYAVNYYGDKEYVYANDVEAFIAAKIPYSKARLLSHDASQINPQVIHTNASVALTLNDGVKEDDPNFESHVSKYYDELTEFEESQY